MINDSMSYDQGSETPQENHFRATHTSASLEPRQRLVWSNGEKIITDTTSTWRIVQLDGPSGTSRGLYGPHGIRIFRKWTLPHAQHVAQVLHDSLEMRGFEEGVLEGKKRAVAAIKAHVQSRLKKNGPFAHLIGIFSAHEFIQEIEKA